MAAGIELSGWTQPPHPSGVPPHAIYSISTLGSVGQRAADLKAAGFSFPALVKPRGPSVFPSPTDPTDWTWTDPAVPTLLRALFMNGYQLIVFSNEMGITTDFNPSHRLAVHKRKIEMIAVQLGLPIRFHFSTRQDDWRMPSPDMFGHYEFMLNANGKEINFAQSFFCGDAAGRHAKKGKPKDYARWDLEFAANAGLHFVLPETAFSPRFLPTLLPSLLLGPQPRPKPPPGPPCPWSYLDAAGRFLSATDAEIALADHARLLSAAREAELTRVQKFVNDERRERDAGPSVLPEASRHRLDLKRMRMPAWLKKVGSSFARLDPPPPELEGASASASRRRESRIIPLSSSPTPSSPGPQTTASSSRVPLKTPFASSLNQPIASSSSQPAPGPSSSPTKRKRMERTGARVVIDLDEESDIEEPEWMGSSQRGKGKGKAKEAATPPPPQPPPRKKAKQSVLDSLEGLLD